MSETLIAAFLSAGVTLLVSLLSNHASAVKSRALIEYKLEELTRRVEKHNSVIERTYALEREVAVIKGGMKIE